MKDGSYQIRAMRKEELKKTLEWAAQEGWNPGFDDVEAFWAADPEGFLLVESGGQMVGSGAIVSYGGQFGFMGLFMIKPEYRGRGWGRDLWYYRRQRLQERLERGAAIGLDGVEAMQGFYTAGGFQKSHDHIRYSGRIDDLGAVPSYPQAQLKEPRELDFTTLEAFDRKHFGAPRTEFLKLWLQPKAGRARVLVSAEGEMLALGVIRKAHEGYRIGPLFAADAEAAATVLWDLLAAYQGQEVAMDVPSVCAAAAPLALRFGLKPGFTCARMYYGEPPKRPWQNIFAVTSLELG